MIEAYKIILKTADIQAYEFLEPVCEKLMMNYSFYRKCLDENKTIIDFGLNLKIPNSIHLKKFEINLHCNRNSTYVVDNEHRVQLSSFSQMVDLKI